MEKDRRPHTGSTLKKSVLVLNASDAPLNLCSWKKAVKLIYLSKALVIESRAEKISDNFPYPSIIRLSKYVSLPFKTVVLNRKNLMLRDNHTCQYCGKKDQLTIDHVIPRSRGGKDTWQNMIVACHRCNHLKGHELLENTELKLLAKPTVPPSALYLELTRQKNYPKNWMRYF